MKVQVRVLAAASLMMAAPAFASETAAPPASHEETAAVQKVAAQAGQDADAIAKADPVICRRQQEIGSLLKTKKVCMTRSQWEDQRQVNRSNIEQSQLQRGLDPAH